MATNFTVILFQRQHFGNDAGIFNDIEPNVPFAGSTKDFSFDCPGVNPGETAFLMFQSGGLVKETGLAVVHEGEYIMPSPGSEAMIEPTQMISQEVVNYYFPVEVVIVGGLPEEEHAAIEVRIWESLGDALERIT